MFSFPTYADLWTFVGLIMIIDLKKFSFMHLLRLPMGALRNFMKYNGEVLLPFYKAVYFINGGYIIDKLFTILRLVSKPELMDKVST